MLSEFATWLVKQVKVSEVSARKYTSAISIISAEMLRLNVITHALDNNISASVLATEINYILSNPNFIEKNRRGNNMYSVALKHYCCFIKEKLAISQSQLHNDTINSTSITDINKLKANFKNYLAKYHTKWSMRTIDTYTSDALFAYNNNLTDNFWNLLADDIGLDECFLVIYDYLCQSNDKEKALSRAKRYYTTVQLLSQYILSQYGSIASFITAFPNLDKTNILNRDNASLDGCQTAIYMQSTDIKYSYKLVLMLAVISVPVFRDIQLTNIVKYFERFYKQRLQKGLCIERHDSVFSKQIHSYQQAAKTIISGPIRAFEHAQMIKYSTSTHTVSISPGLRRDIERHSDIISDICNKRIEAYYDKLEEDNFYKGNITPPWLCGRKIRHLQYGLGVIDSCVNGEIWIYFSDEVMRKIPTSSITLNYLSLV